MVSINKLRLVNEPSKYESGFPDFMDALSDPRAYLNQQEKRAEQLKSIGIDENDISTENVIMGASGAAAAGAGAGAGSKGLPGLPGVASKKRTEEKEEVRGKNTIFLNERFNTFNRKN